MKAALGVWVVLVLAAGVAAAVAIGGDEGGGDVATSTTSSTTQVTFGEPLPPSAPEALPEGARVADGPPPTVEPAPTSSTRATVSQTGPRSRWPALPDDGVARALLTPTGVVVAVERTNEDGSYVVFSPCGRSVTVSGGRPITGAHVVLDAGHGGDEPGAVGPRGLQEADVNLAVAAEAVRDLEARGAVVVPTRTGDYRMTLASRAAIATALDADAFVSIHHNSDPDGDFDGPGSEAWYQQRSSASRRLAGLLVEELRSELSGFEADWVGDTDAGAKSRPGSDGEDFYGVLRLAAVPAVLAEASFISNEDEEQLLSTAEFRRAEAVAIGRAVERFVLTDDPGSGFTEAYPRDEPAGGGGGAEGCEDPPLE